MKKDTAKKTLLALALTLAMTAANLAFADEPANVQDAEKMPPPMGDMMPPPHPMAEGMQTDGPGGPMQRPGRPNDVRMIMRRLQNEEPETYQRLVQLRQQDKKKFAEEIGKYRQQEFKVIEKIMENERKCWKLGKRIRQAKTEEEKTALTAELKGLIDEAHEQVLKSFQERLTQLQKDFDNLQKEGDALKAKRLELYLTQEQPMIARPQKGAKGPRGVKGPNGPEGRRQPKGGQPGEMPPPAGEMGGQPGEMPPPAGEMGGQPGEMPTPPPAGEMGGQPGEMPPPPPADAE